MEQDKSESAISFYKGIIAGKQSLQVLTSEESSIAMVLPLGRCKPDGLEFTLTDKDLSRIGTSLEVYVGTAKGQVMKQEEIQRALKKLEDSYQDIYKKFSPTKEWRFTSGFGWGTAYSLEVSGDGMKETVSRILSTLEEHCR